MAHNGEQGSLTSDGRVIVWRVPEAWHPYPWRLAVEFDGVRYDYAGIPNQCETRRQAAARAGWRLRWLREGRHPYGPFPAR